MYRTDTRTKDIDRARAVLASRRLCSAPTSSGPLPRQVSRTITPRRCYMKNICSLLESKPSYDPLAVDPVIEDLIEGR
jgi:hypothetical protein